jgi:uncharacterized LabA/DUF88 family protein
MPLAANPSKTAEVIHTEEKGSDVNLGVHLVNDAWLNRYDCAVVVSNDSDLAEAISLVKAPESGGRFDNAAKTNGSTQERSGLLSSYHQDAFETLATTENDPWDQHK